MVWQLSETTEPIPRSVMAGDLQGKEIKKGVFREVQDLLLSKNILDRFMVLLLYT